MLLIVENIGQQHCSWENHSDSPKTRMSALWFWYHSGLERVNHPLPLSKNGLTGSSPLARPSQSVLVRSAGTHESTHCQFGVPYQEPHNVWSNPNQLCHRVQVRNVVHLEGITLWAGEPNRECKNIHRNISELSVNVTAAHGSYRLEKLSLDMSPTSDAWLLSLSQFLSSWFLLRGVSLSLHDIKKDFYYFSPNVLFLFKISKHTSC